MRLRSLLLWLVLAAIVPLAVFSAILATMLVERERETFRRAALERSLSILTAIESELKGTISALEAFATSPTLDHDDLAGFRVRAARILATQPDWSTVHLALPSGQQILNLRRPQGAPLPRIPDAETVERVVRSAEPAVSNMVLGPITGEVNFAVRVPVAREGRVKYVLSAVVKPASILRLMRLQEFPADWVGLVMDRKGQVVARTLNSEKNLGQPASENMRATLTREPSGWFLGRTLEGGEFWTPYYRSTAHGWTVAIGIPAATVSEGARRAAWILAGALLAAVAAALLLARLVSHRVSKPIASLAAAAEAIGRGAPHEIRNGTRVAEIEALADTVKTAAVAVREREALLEREKRALQATDRAKDEFIAMLSHELRNPLSALMSASHILERMDPAAEAAANARRIVARQTKHMAKLVEDLLDVSRVAMGKAALEREVFDLAAAVSRLVATWRSTGRLNGRRIDLSVSPAWVNADHARVEQMLSNLLDNALKFGRGQPVWIGVRTEKGEAVLEVADGGEGLAPEMAQRVFDLFVQGETDLARTRGGMGVGLALVRRLAELHGGSASVSSEGPGRGATFTVRFPATAPVEETLMPRVPSRTVVPRRILLIEDNDDARQMLCKALQLNGHEVSAASDGTTGIAAASKMHPDVVLVDIGLPDMDGYEVARRLRAQTYRQPLLIALTGYGQADDRRRADDAGFDAHLLKPVTVERLEEVMLASMPGHA